MTQARFERANSAEEVYPPLVVVADTCHSPPGLLRSNAGYDVGNLMLGQRWGRLKLREIVSVEQTPPHLVRTRYWSIGLVSVYQLPHGKEGREEVPDITRA